ncbi:hypothetical protein [Perlabentimonas gracilis]|uniref:hypothetical protein n=1 Tax=Perlabentimonas gracilis TaxID=2715279 RepID=UPI00140DC486|nr:hypothetical protein [Perlabentimonas gracilis]NHB67713.1 hypothetical protein [Perlabentimonas gracilis]
MSLIFHILIYLITLSVFIYVSLLLKPRIWLHRMPPAVRAKVNGKTPEERRWFVILGVPLGLVFFFYPIAITALMYNQLHHILLSLFAFTAGFAIWDTLILDLLIFCGITPKPMIIEGTTKHDYKDKMYHLKSGAKGLVMAIVYSVVMGLLVYCI